MASARVRLANTPIQTRWRLIQFILQRLDIRHSISLYRNSIRTRLRSRTSPLLISPIRPRTMRRLNTPPKHHSTASRSISPDRIRRQEHHRKGMVKGIQPDHMPRLALSTLSTPASSCSPTTGTRAAHLMTGGSRP